MVCDFDGSTGSRDVSYVGNKGTSFASCAFACEGLLLNLNALLTKKLPKFLSRLNEMSGGKENMSESFFDKLRQRAIF